LISSPLQYLVKLLHPPAIASLLRSKYSLIPSECKTKLRPIHSSRWSYSLYILIATSSDKVNMLSNLNTSLVSIPRFYGTRRFIAVLTKACVIFRNKLLFYGEELLATSPTLNLDDHPLSAVREYIYTYPPYWRSFTRLCWDRVKLPLCLKIGAVEVQLHVFLISALDGGEWSASWPGCFILGVRVPATHWIGGWVGPRAGLDAVTKNPCPFRQSNPGLPACSLVTILAELHRLPSLVLLILIRCYWSLHCILQCLESGVERNQLHIHNATRGTCFCRGLSAFFRMKKRFWLLCPGTLCKATARQGNIRN
jgi:hypothetical protein